MSARIHVTLVNLNRITIPAIAPYALDVLASALDRDGHRVDILDLCRAEDPLAAIAGYFANERPDLTCLSMRNAGDLYFPSFFHLADAGSFLGSHQRLIDAVKRFVPIDRLLLGGVGFSVNPQGFLKRLGLRYGVRGRGERTLRELAPRLAAETLSSIAAGADTFVFDGRADPLSVPVKRSFVDNRWYYEFGGQAAVRTTVGCPMTCSYCAEPAATGRSYNSADLEDALAELDQLVAMGIHDVQTADSEFNMPLARSKAFLRAVADRGYRELRLWAYCQPRPFDEEFASLLAKAGVVGINFGTDHTDGEVLVRLRKWYTRDDIERATELCRDHGIAVMHELLFGSPGDTPEKMYRAVEEVIRLQPRVVGVTIGLGVFPGTPLGDLMARRNGCGNGDGFYCAGEPTVDPTFYVDPAFEIPRVFNDLAARVGNGHGNLMLPTVDSTSAANNQLVNSERVRHQLLVERRKGPSWYHFPDEAR